MTLQAYNSTQNYNNNTILVQKKNKNKYKYDTIIIFSLLFSLSHLSPLSPVQVAGLHFHITMLYNYFSGP